jgi:PmbA protein
MTVEQILALGKTMGFESLEITTQINETTTIVVFKQKLENFKLKNTYSMVLRGIYQGKMGNVSIETEDDDSIKNALVQLKENAQLITDSAKEEMMDGNGVYEKANNPEDLDNTSTSTIITSLMKLEQRIFDASPLIVDYAGAHYEKETSTIRKVNSLGLSLENSYSFQYVYAQAIAKKDNETSNWYSMDVETSFDKMEWDRIVEESTKTALQLLDAKFIPSGTYPILLDKDVSSQILNAFSSMFSGESAMKKMTLLRGKENTKVFGENITLIDDPLSEVAVIRTNFDAEGVPTRKNVLVENGVFKGLCHNLKTARFFQTTSTGNAVEGNGGITSSVHNLYLVPGEKSIDEIISTMDKGIFVKEVEGLHSGLNPISGDFNVQSKGYWVENGKIDHAVTLFVISGNFFEMFNHVDAIAKEIDLNKSTGGVNSPALLIHSLKVSGK